jgi:hypothetical protein
MNPWRWVDPRVKTVRLADLQAYLHHKGWTLKPNPNAHLLRYVEPSVKRGRPFYYMVPSSDDYDTFGMDVINMITTFSELEDRHPVELLNDILRCGAEAAQANGTRRRKTKTVRP